MPDPKPDDVDFHEETTDPLVADLHNFYMVEKWTRDGTRVDSLLYAGNSLGRPAPCLSAPSSISRSEKFPEINPFSSNFPRRLAAARWVCNTRFNLSRLALPFRAGRVLRLYVAFPLGRR
jgi:hypothetical protein